MAIDRPCALVTGGARRVGRAIALELATLGHDIALTYRTSRDDAREAVSLIEKTGARAVAIQADHGDPGSIPSLRAQVIDAFGGIKVLVNNASAFTPGDLQQSNLAEMRALWSLHIETPLLLCQAFERELRAASGHVINMVDLLAEKPWPKFLAYSASKAALANLTRGLAREMAPEVTVNAIAPGVVDWPDDFPQDQRDAYLKTVPLARAGTPIDVAKLVGFLCTGGSYITGQILRLDGGKSLI